MTILISSFARVTLFLLINLHLQTSISAHFLKSEVLPMQVQRQVKLVWVLQQEIRHHQSSIRLQPAPFRSCIRPHLLIQPSWPPTIAGVRVDAVRPRHGVPAWLGRWWVTFWHWEILKLSLSAFGIIHELGKSPWGWSSAQITFQKRILAH